LSKPSNEPSREQIHEPTKRLGQDALLPGNLSSKRVLFRVSMMDDEIQSCKTHSEYTKSYQVAIPVSFVSFHSKSFGLAYCWVHSHWKTTADLFNAQHSIQFARIKRSFISARVLISTFDGSTSSSRMACWVRTLTVKVPLLHQTNHAVLSEWWYKQQDYVPFISCWDLPQSAKAASKATAEMQASADSNIMPSIFQLIVGSKQTYRRKPQQDLVDSSSSKTIIFETSNAFSRRLIVTFIKPNANFPLLKSSLQSAPNSLLERNDKFIVKSKSEGARAAPNHSSQLIFTSIDSEISFRFCKDCRIFREGEWEWDVKDDVKAVVKRQSANDNCNWDSCRSVEADTKAILETNALPFSGKSKTSFDCTSASTFQLVVAYYDWIPQAASMTEIC
jgi:hypothetical protein